MELDTGAGKCISIISEETYQRLFKEIPLMPSTAKLHAYTGDPIQVCGQFNVDVKYKQQSATLPLTMVKGTGPSLLGRNWLAKIRLDCEEIFSVRVSESSLSQDTSQQLHTILGGHSDLFKDKLGTIKGITA